MLASKGDLGIKPLIYLNILPDPLHSQPQGGWGREHLPSTLGERGAWRDHLEKGCQWTNVRLTPETLKWQGTSWLKALRKEELSQDSLELSEFLRMKDGSWSPIKWAPCKRVALDFAWEGRVDLKETKGIPRVAQVSKRRPAWSTEMEMHWHTWREGWRGKGKPRRRGGETEKFTAVSLERWF